tara:strand:- start:3815 stop:4246 length:432 start_codon:yes stop_codon:yes gene_type:complete
MKIEKIKSLVTKGIKVFWVNDNYEVIKDSKDQFLIHSKSNDNYVGLTNKKGELNEDEDEFYIINNLSDVQKLKLNLAIDDAAFWGEWLKTEKNKVDEKIFKIEDFHQRMAIEAGVKSVLTNVAIEKIDDILKLLKEIQDEQTN